jgi:hypothetical protein
MGGGGGSSTESFFQKRPTVISSMQSVAMDKAMQSFSSLQKVGGQVGAA